MNQPLFISWSGELSRKVAEEFHKWIPSVIQAVDPFLSSEDIEKGARWSEQIATMLQDSGFGLIILTPQNLQAPWILFEAGALSKMVGKSNVAPILINTQITQVRPPLTQFQATKFEKNDIFKLLRTLNKACPKAINEDILRRSFDALWPQFETSVNQIAAAYQVSQTEEEQEEVTLNSVSLSIGELIRTVHLLKSDIRVGRDRNIPWGLVDDLKKIESQLRENVDADGDIVMMSPESSEIMSELGFITSYLDRNVRRPIPLRKAKVSTSTITSEAKVSANEDDEE